MSGHGGARPGHSGTRSGLGGSHAGQGGHLHRSHRPHRGSPVPFFGYSGWYFGGCSWIWNDWNCWDTPNGVLFPPVEEVDDSDQELDAEVSADVTDTPPARDARSGSALVFDVSPEDAVIYVDDEYEGTAADLNELERGLRVPPGEHVVTVLRPGFHDSTVTVKTRAGKSTNIDVNLTR
jgi:hypothetical protein